VFGLRGEVKVDPSRIGDDALAVGLVLDATLRGGAVRALRVRAIRRHKGRPLVTFEGVEDASAAEALVGATLQVDRGEVALGEGEYLDDDLVGCTLVDEEAQNALGEVVAVEHYPTQDVLVVGARRALVPLVRAFVRGIDVPARRIVVTLPPGLLDPAQAEQA
jgi:16S rRNA processing protein RimM